MGVDLDTRPDAISGGQTHVDERRAPGKQPRTARLTGKPLLDKGLYCDRPESEGDPGCHLDKTQGRDLLGMIATAAGGVNMNFLAACQSVRAELVMKHLKSWGVAKELGLLAFGMAISWPLAAAVAGLSAAAVPALAASREAIMTGTNHVQGTLQRGVRAELAHDTGGPPKDLIAFVDYLQTLIAPFPGDIVQAVAADNLDHDQMMALLAKLEDQSLIGVAAVRGRILKLLEQYEQNYIPVIGNQMFGTREVAAPVLATLRKKKYAVLCEAFGNRHSALALNGANIDRDQPRITMDSLVFMRIADRFFWPVIQNMWKERRPDEPVLEVNFDDRAQRGQHRWFGDFYTEIMHHPNARELAIEDGGAEDDA
jgi:hypothetical protein